MKLEINEYYNYYFSIPLQGVKCDKIHLDFPSSFCYCSIYFPESLQSPYERYFLIRIFDRFTINEDQNIVEIESSNLLFGETLMFPKIRLRGEMKWNYKGNKHFPRSMADIPDLKMSSINLNVAPEQRRWFLLKNAGFNQKSWNSNKVNFSDVENLELGFGMTEANIKLRIYLVLIQRQITKMTIFLSEDEWKKILLKLALIEPIFKRAKLTEIEDEIDNFLRIYHNISKY